MMVVNNLLVEVLAKPTKVVKKWVMCMTKELTLFKVEFNLALNDHNLTDQMLINLQLKRM